MDDVDFDQLEAVLEGQQVVGDNDQAFPVSSSRAFPPSDISNDKQRYSEERQNGREKGHHTDRARDRRRSKSSSNRRVRDSSRRSDPDGRGCIDRRGSRSRSYNNYSKRVRKRSGSSSSQETRDHHRSRRSKRDHGERSLRSPSMSHAERKRIEEQKRLEELREKEELRRKQEEERRIREEEEKRKREHDEARRDDLTVLILNLSLKATEREIWKFFSEKAGKVRDIQVIRDTRSGKSKGVGYVEFYAPQAVLQALALSGSYILDIPIIVQASQAEKNRAAKAAKQQAAEITEGGPMKIYVGGLVDSLSTLTDYDLKQLFSPFGEIGTVELHKDPYTGRCKGYGFIQFRHAQDAREAMAAMNGFDIGGRQIKVGYATDPGQRQLAPLTAGDSLHGVPLGNNLAAAQTALESALMFAESQTDNERLDDEGGGLLSGVNPRISLMQKLQRIDPTQTAPGGSLSGMSVPQPPTVAPPSAQLIPGGLGIPMAGPAFSCNICLEPLFTEAEVIQEGSSFLDDVLEDVRTECSKYGVVMQVWLNRKKVDGKVWVKFGGPDQAVKANQALNGRYFAGKPINVTFVTEPVWTITCIY